ncbi:MAG: acetyltransferase [Opitutales bacterium]
MEAGIELVVAGAGGFGREVADWAEQAGWRVAGLIDDRADALTGHPSRFRLLGPIHSFQPEPQHRVVVAIAKPSAKAAVWERLAASGASFGSVIHPSVVMGSGVTTGPGFIACPGVTLTTAITFGRGVSLNLHCCIGHDCRLGDFCHLNSYTQLGGGTCFGERVTSGAHACVVPGVTVEPDAILGAGAVVIRRVKAGQTVFGNPARPL